MKLHAQPTVILLSSKVDESIDEHLNPEGKSRGSINGDGVATMQFCGRQLTWCALSGSVPIAVHL